MSKIGFACYLEGGAKAITPANQNTSHTCVRLCHSTFGGVDVKILDDILPEKCIKSATHSAMTEMA